MMDFLPEVIPKIQHLSKGKPHLVIWKILRNPRGEGRCIPSTLEGHEATGKGKQGTEARSPVTPHNLPAAQEQSQCVHLNFKCHSERANPVCGIWAPQPESHPVYNHSCPCCSCMRTRRGCKVRGTEVNLVPGLNVIFERIGLCRN